MSRPIVRLRAGSSARRQEYDAPADVDFEVRMDAIYSLTQAATNVEMPYALPGSEKPFYMVTPSSNKIQGSFRVIGEHASSKLPAFGVCCAGDPASLPATWVVIPARHQWRPVSVRIEQMDSMQTYFFDALFIGESKEKFRLSLCVAGPTSPATDLKDITLTAANSTKEVVVPSEESRTTHGGWSDYNTQIMLFKRALDKAVSHVREWAEAKDGRRSAALVALASPGPYCEAQISAWNQAMPLLGWRVPDVRELCAPPHAGMHVGFRTFGGVESAFHTIPGWTIPGIVIEMRLPFSRLSPIEWELLSKYLRTRPSDLHGYDIRKPAKGRVIQGHFSEALGELRARPWRPSRLQIG